MPTSSELRTRARAQLGGNIFASKWLYVLLANLILSLILGFLCSGFWAVIGFLATGPLVVGFVAICLKQVRNNAQPVNMGDCFYGLTGNRLGRNVALGVLIYIFTVLWSILFVIPGIIKGYSYAMSYFISLDRPDLDANACITESRRMMNGHKWRLFCLDLSFVGWYIVGAICFGIGVLWVAPYHEMARANFYDDLCSRTAAVM